MDFQRAIVVCVKEKPFNWKDRASRSEFWWFYLFATIVNFVTAIIGVVPILGPLINLVVSIAMSWLVWMATIRRLHDTNRSGWYSMLPFGYAMFAIAVTVGMSDSFNEDEDIGTLMLLVVGMFAVLIYLLVLLILKGTDGPNRFGPDPLALENGGYGYNQPGQFNANGQYNGQGFNPNGPGFNPNGPGFNPNGQGFDPNGPGFNPNGQGFGPNAQGFGPGPNGPYNGDQGFNQGGQGFGPYNGGQGFNQGGPQGFDPNGQGFGPNGPFNGNQGFNQGGPGFGPNGQGFGPNGPFNGNQGFGPGGPQGGPQGFDPNSQGFNQGGPGFNQNAQQGFNPNAPQGFSPNAQQGFGQQGQSNDSNFHYGDQNPNNAAPSNDQLSDRDLYEPPRNRDDSDNNGGNHRQF